MKFVPLVMILSSAAWANAPTSPTPPAVTTTPVKPAASPVITATATPAGPALTADEKKSLLSEFKKAKATAEKAMKHQEQSQLKELSAAISSQAKQWREKEKKERRIFFDAHLSGPERRQYVQDYLERKKKFDQSQRDTLAAKRHEWDLKRAEFKNIVTTQETDFNKSVEQGIRPNLNLWPKSP